MKTIMRSLTALAALSLSLALAACGDWSGNGDDGTSNSSYPEKAITVIVPFPAGSAPDSNARIIAQQMEQDLGQRVIIENVEGGAGTVGLTELQGSDNDGYTLGYGASAAVTIQSRLIDNPFKPEGLTPIAMVQKVPIVIVASPDRGWDSIDDFIAAAKANPGGVSIGSGNAGSVLDISVRILEQKAGIKLKKAYFDAGQQIVPAVNGTVDSAVSQFTPVVQYVEKGDLEHVGVFGDELPEGIDGVPTFTDAGYDTSRVRTWEGIFGPAGLPDEIVKKIAASVKKATESQAYLDFMAKTKGIPAYLPTAEFADLVQQTDDEAPKIIDELGLKPN